MVFTSSQTRRSSALYCISHGLSEALREQARNKWLLWIGMEGIQLTQIEGPPSSCECGKNSACLWGAFVPCSMASEHKRVQQYTENNGVCVSTMDSVSVSCSSTGPSYVRLQMGLQLKQSLFNSSHCFHYYTLRWYHRTLKVCDSVNQNDL